MLCAEIMGVGLGLSVREYAIEAMRHKIGGILYFNSHLIKTWI